MKSNLIIAFIVTLSFSAFSQEHPSFISLNAGPSIAVGSFHAKDLSGGSFAMTGLALSVQGAWFFREYLGVGGYAGLSMNPVDVQALGYEKVKDDPFLLDMTIRSDPYRMYGAYAGFFGDHRLTDRLSVTAKLLGGLVFATTPYQLYKPEYFLVETKWYEITSAGDYAFSLLAGAGIRYRVNPCISLLLQGDFTYHRMQFEFLRGDGTTRTEDTKIALVNTAFGVCFHFGNKSTTQGM